MPLPSQYRCRHSKDYFSVPVRAPYPQHTVAHPRYENFNPVPASMPLPPHMPHSSRLKVDETLMLYPNLRTSTCQAYLNLRWGMIGERLHRTTWPDENTPHGQPWIQQLRIGGALGDDCASPESMLTPAGIQTLNLTSDSQPT